MSRVVSYIVNAIGEDSDFWISRFVFQRALGFTYLVAFLAVVNQFQPLLGEKGLLPIGRFVANVSFWQSPSLFFAFPFDGALTLFGWLGLLLAITATVGLSERFSTPVSVGIWFGLWILYLSFVNVGQRFYSFGWETMLLETGFVAMFLGSNRSRPSVITIILLRWILFRTMFGSGLIKLRGDACWTDFSCMQFHHQTQPMPNPLSWHFHHLPVVFHQLSVLYNHFVELIVPFFYFVAQPWAALAGVLTLIFHGTLFVSGNYAFLGFLTMVLTISVFNDRILGKVIPLRKPASTPPHSQRRTEALYLLTTGVAIMSIFPIINLLSPNQAMNRSYTPLHLVNSYGAFGSVTNKRYEVVVEGTRDTELNAETDWREYEFKAKPTSLTRLPDHYAPYHLRLDWLAWFEGIGAGAGYEAGGLSQTGPTSQSGPTSPSRESASSPRESAPPPIEPAQVAPTSEPTSPPGGQYRRSPWFINFLVKLLEGDAETLSLLHSAPFGDERPEYVRVLLYEYRFTTPDQRRQTGAIWQREFKDIYLPPLSLNDPPAREVMQVFGR